MHHIDLVEQYSAHNYHPLPVVLAKGEGAWVTDVNGKRYLDALAGYSALNFGHHNEQIIARAQEQLSKLTLTSRAFNNDQLGPFVESLSALCKKERVLPMNSGAEAVETAIKVSRRWGYKVKGVAPNSAKIIVMDGNFHGRTTTIISFSTDQDAREYYGPYTPGFEVCPYGDIDALAAMIDENTVAVLLEPIQGEGGVVIPPAGYLSGVRKLCTEKHVLMVADEIQSGLARTGKTFACDHEEVTPDIIVMGKALGGGIMPVSAIACDSDIMDVITPGSHGSTFGGNPFASAIGHEVVGILATGEYQEKSASLGDLLAARLEGLTKVGATAVRSRGLWVGIDIDPELMSGRELVERMMVRGVLAKDCHGSTIRLAPPLVVTAAEVNMLADVIYDSLQAGNHTETRVAS